MARTYKKKGSKKARYVELFNLAIPRLERGEIVLVALEDGDGEHALVDAQTFRVYWAGWKKAKLFLSINEPLKWLDEVVVSIIQRPNRTLASLYRKGAFERVALGQVEQPHETLMVTGKGASIQAHIPREVSDPQALAVLNSIDSSTQEKWLNWVVREKRDPERHYAMFDVDFDSPEAQAYRAAA